ncbi:testican-1-like [Paramacrobiotus metropolitanus]|uniref:testican-1-like n=1 Tax=Paramacrobiotus metropolitanus TaxID=2943436 RepID=UPI002445EDD0|nr:testican-1-like [Paramacrobiotus metropolitanus]
MPAPEPLKKTEMRNEGWLDDPSGGRENDINVHKPAKTKLSSSVCSKKEMKELRFRLNEWFYTVFRQKVEEGSPEDFVQNPVCQNGPHHAVLSWIFLYFDDNKDNSLSLRELFDLEADKYERCINPLLEFCDKNSDLEISGVEWCHCFQGKGGAKTLSRRHY